MFRLVPSRTLVFLSPLQHVRWYHGHVKSFNNKKGFGFIHPEYELQNDIIERYGSWKDVFVHYTDIADDIRLLIPTNKVTFDCIFDDNGPVAKNIHKIIPKRNKVAIERWLEAPSDIDELVQKKSLLSPEQWLRYMHSFYKRIAAVTPSGKVEYTNTDLCVNSNGKKREDYLNMINDLYLNFSDSNTQISESEDSTT